MVDRLVAEWNNALQEADLKYLVLGAGALGSVFGGMLQKNGHDVTFVGRGRHLEKIRNAGLTLTGLWGDQHLDKLECFERIEDVTGSFDVILLCVKSYDTAAVMRQAAHLVGDDTLVVSIQNGLGNWEMIAEVVGWERTVGGRVIFGAEIAEPGVARVTVYADKVLLGSPCGDVASERIKRVCDELDGAGIPTAFTDEIERFIWNKVLYNSCLNPLGAILQCPYGELVKTPALVDTMRRIIEEIFAVAAARKVNLGYDDPQEYFDVLMKVQLPPTVEHRASMLQDLERGRRTEIDALNGAVSRYGRENGLATPVNDTLVALIRELERRI